MMTDTAKNLYFLLCAAPMGIAGCVVDLDPSDTSLGTPTETGGNGDTGEGEGDTGDGDGDPGDGDGDTEDGDGDGDTGDGDGDSDVCTGFGAKYGECYGAQYTDDAILSCEDLIAWGEMYYGMACKEAFEAQFVCISGLSCGLLQDAFGCEVEVDARVMLCGF